MRKRLLIILLSTALLALTACQKVQTKTEGSKDIAAATATTTTTTQPDKPNDENTECTIAPEYEDRFTDKQIKNKEELTARFPAIKNMSIVWEQLKNHFCTDESFSLYSHEMSKSVVLVANCRAKIRLDNGDQTNESLSDREYPLVFIVQDNTIFEFENFLEFGFMYETGSLKYITDRNHDGNPEFWLEGTDYECDGEGECKNPCDSQGGMVVEVSRGKGVQIQNSQAL